MGDPWAEKRTTVLSADGTAFKVYTSLAGALYALFSKAETLEIAAQIDQNFPGQRIPPASPQEREAWLWQRSDFPEFVVSTREQRFAGDWWNVARLQRPQPSLDFWEAMRDAGNMAYPEHRVWLSTVRLAERPGDPPGYGTSFGPYQVPESAQ